jgi:opacity protein-like surface antigen
MPKWSFKLASIVLLLSIFSCSFAFSLFNIPDISLYAGATLGSGFSHSSGNSSAQLIYTPDSPTVFATDSHSDALNYGVFAGGAKKRESVSPWFNTFSLEFGLWQQNALTVKGVQSINDPNMVNWQYNYSYKVALKGLSLDVLTSVYRWKNLSFLAGLGMDLAQVSMSDYQQKAVGDAQDYQLLVANKTENKMLYHVDVGINYTITEHWQARLLYAYYPSFKVMTGTVDTGFVTMPSLNDKITLSRIAVSVSYLF